MRKRRPSVSAGLSRWLPVMRAVLQADAQNNLGLAQFLAGDRAAAANAFVAALQLDPNHAHAQC